MFDWWRNTRQRIAERMDDDHADPESLRRSLAFIRAINRRLGYTRAILGHLERFSRSWTAGECITLIDLATGTADIPRAILAWADQRGHSMRIVAVDRHPVTIREATAGPPDDRLQIVQGDVFALPFAPGSFDYVLTAMFLHHLDEPEIVRVLENMDGLARRGIIAADLLRHRRAYAWIRLISLGSTEMVRHDGPASVAQALTRREALDLRDAAGVGYASYHRHFGHRFVLAGEKPAGRAC